MKIMRADSWRGGYDGRRGWARMAHGIRIPRRTIRRGATSTRRLSMTWQTPQACDFRFGFEITMYISAR
jgi:pyrroloquinoline quinone biosynthesis protein A